MTRRPVFVAGVGAVTPLGVTWAESVAELALGHGAIGPITTFDTSGFPSTVAASVAHTFAHTDDRRLGLAQLAAREAWSMARVTAPPSRIGIFMGAESGRAKLATVLRLSRAAGGGRVFDHQAFGRQERALASGIEASVVSPAAVTSELAREFRISGPAQTISIACASGAAAIAEATRAIRIGTCDVALCGGVGADVDPLMLAGFGKLAALSARGISCPFDLRRDGFVVGEGAAIVVLSAEPSPLGIAVTGIGRTLDAYHLTQPDPQGQGAARAMQAALTDAQCRTVGYIQAHGTSTQLNDAIEARAIQRVFPQEWANIYVSSVKGALGHWVAGAGAIGFLCALEAVRSGFMMPTVNLTQPDPACPLRHIMGSAVRKKISAAMINAFAFGGANTSIVIEQVTQ